MLPQTNSDLEGARYRTALTVSSGDHDAAAPHPATSAASYGRIPANSPPPVGASEYLGRILDPSQMDVQSALDQMRTLLSLQPQRVYKTSYYRKQTKNHWARDDPAFAAVQCALLLLASVAYSVAFRPPSGSLLSTMAGFAFRSIFVNYLGCGLLVAAAGRAIADRHLTTGGGARTTGGTGTGGGGAVGSGAAGGGRSGGVVGGGGGGGGRLFTVRQAVEFLYAVDIHCNAFFPLFVAVYGVQFFLLPLVLSDSLMSLVLSNTLFAAAFGWYFYVTHLGYRALPFLHNTEVFLFPIAAVAFIYAFNLIGYPFGLGFNASRIMAFFYFEQ